MDPVQILEILKAGETGIGVNTLMLMYLTWLTRKSAKKVDDHEKRITVLEVHTGVTNKDHKPVTA